MAVESANRIHQLNVAAPANSDPTSEGAGHLRVIKAAVKGSFPNFGTAADTGICTATAGELNALIGLEDPANWLEPYLATYTGFDSRYYTETEVNVILEDFALSTEVTAEIGAALADYVPAAGGAFTGVVGGVTPTAAGHLATKGYVDGLIEDPAGPVAFSGCKRYANATQSLTGTFANLTLGTVGYNLGTYTTGTTSITIPADGIYELSAGVMIASPGGGEPTDALIVLEILGGSTVLASQSCRAPATDTGSANVSGVAQLTSGTVITARAKSTFDNRTTRVAGQGTFLSVTKLG